MLGLNTGNHGQQRQKGASGERQKGASNVRPRVPVTQIGRTDFTQVITGYIMLLILYPFFLDWMNRVRRCEAPHSLVKLGALLPESPHVRLDSPGFIYILWF